ncbi:hypothetical protein [Flavobacterium sp. N1736]|uniref:hypothetical protein n=1 Tax=Flavobacterium sp. N1736 TaxID=2986823 RepID=UPI0022253640|nr:hypothetical protein [Flavobacterium sp. N1736]
MRTQIKLKAALFILLAGLSFSCKKNENAPADNYTNEADTTQETIDSVGTTPDTTSANSSTNGTTGATGEGSTGSGAAGTTQKGNTSVRTDSTATASKK